MLASLRVVELATPHGAARAHLADAGESAPLVVLGHGAGGSIAAPDLQAVARAAQAAGASVALVEQPYRVAGRRSSPPAAQLDAAWIAVVEQLRDGAVPLVTGGRSAGARVACRTATVTGAAAVLCLAFPLITPKGASRQDELDAVAVPVLVVQGERDRFGMPAPGPRRDVVAVPGDHALKADVDAVARAATTWLQRIGTFEA